MTYQFVRVERKGRVTLVSLDRPGSMNAIHPPASVELGRVFDDFAADPEQWVAIVTGCGDRAFCAGNDLKFQAEHGVAEMERLLAGASGGFAGLCDRTDLHKPVIAAVNGLALGGGLEIVLSCDIVVAAEHASFGLPEPRVGLMPGAPGVYGLPRRIPHHLAMGMLLTGGRIDARTAARFGLVNEVVPGPDLLAAAQRWVAEILRCAPLSVRAIKEAVIDGMSVPPRVALTLPIRGLDRLKASADAIEGPRAFAEKREPRWTGA
jgi:enoyl-CoA hydratase/carnithine racemase